jgi:hypothetical protein
MLLKTGSNFSSGGTIRLAVSGIILAFNVILLWFASFVPAIEMTIMAICGATVYLISRMYKPLTSLLVFTASIILALLIVPNKLMILPYFFLFGPYAVIKPIIDGIAERAKKKKLLVGYVMKTLVFIILLGVSYLIFKEALFAGVRLPEFIPDKLLPALIIVAAAIFFYIFDYVLGLLYTILYRYIPKKIIPK